MAANQRFAGDAWHDKEVRRRTRLALGLARGQRMTPAQQAQFKKEFRRQTKLFRQEREVAKVTCTKQHREESLQAREDYIRLCQQEEAWGAAHEEDTDEALLDYIRRCAGELGHTPALREVEGGTYLGQRFGSWSVALHLAELPLRRGMKEPSRSTLNAYLKRRQAALAAQEI